MSKERSLFHGWRARTHYLTRNRLFLLRTAASIIASGMIIASVIVIGAVSHGEPKQSPGVSLELSRLHEEFNRLQHEPTPQPRQLAIWLRMLPGPAA